MIYIGTSGYFYKNWIGDFYPPNLPSYKFFEYYVKYFNSLELNSTFYRFPKISTIKNWKYRIKNDDFKLSIKVNRIITHIKKLEYNEKINEFLEIINVLGDKLGVIFFQLPPSLKYDNVKLENFLKVLDLKYKYAIEFRNKTWYNNQTYEILKKYNIALVWHDYNQDFIFEQTANFNYVRFHGYIARYKGSYPNEFLKKIANKLSNNSFVYFNNTDDNSAYKDAIKFRKIVEEIKSF